MTGIQKIVCILLCGCLFGIFAAGHSASHWSLWEEQGQVGALEKWMPMMAFYQKEESEKSQPEDEHTYQAILEDNQNYIKEQAEGENKQIKEQQEEAVQEKKKQQKEKAEKEEKEKEKAQPAMVAEVPREKLADYEYLQEHFFIIDENTAAGSDLLNADALTGTDMTIPADQPSPQILIYHSHSQETYADSTEGDGATTVVGVGNTLVDILQNTYGFGVLHVTDTFDVIDGEIDRNSAYDFAREKVQQVLAENPSIQVVIDLHRDGVPEEKHLVTEIDGKSTAQIMFFNGLSYSAANGVIEYLPNPYIGDNLAFSFQLQLISEEYFPGLNRPIYLAGLRYNLHLKPRALLIEVGAQNNTVEEAKNAMTPLGFMLNKVLRG